MWSPVIPREPEQFPRLRGHCRGRLFLLVRRRLARLDETVIGAKCPEFAPRDYKFRDAEIEPRPYRGPFWINADVPFVERDGARAYASVGTVPPRYAAS